MRLNPLSITQVIPGTVREVSAIADETQSNEAISKENCGDYFLVINAPGAHEGVAGIVAGNLKEQYFRNFFSTFSSFQA